MVFVGHADRLRVSAALIVLPLWARHAVLGRVSPLAALFFQLAVTVRPFWPQLVVRFDVSPNAGADYALERLAWIVAWSLVAVRGAFEASHWYSSLVEAP